MPLPRRASRRENGRAELPRHAISPATPLEFQRSALARSPRPSRQSGECRSHVRVARPEAQADPLPLSRCTPNTWPADGGHRAHGLNGSAHIGYRFDNRQLRAQASHAHGHGACAKSGLSVCRLYSFARTFRHAFTVTSLQLDYLGAPTAHRPTVLRCQHTNNTASKACQACAQSPRRLSSRVREHSVPSADPSHAPTASRSWCR